MGGELSILRKTPFQFIIFSTVELQLQFPFQFVGCNYGNQLTECSQLLISEFLKPQILWKLFGLYWDQLYPVSQAESSGIIIKNILLSLFKSLRTENGQKSKVIEFIGCIKEFRLPTEVLHGREEIRKFIFF